MNCQSTDSWFQYVLPLQYNFSQDGFCCFLCNTLLQPKTEVGCTLWDYNCCLPICKCDYSCPNCNKTFTNFGWYNQYQFFIEEVPSIFNIGFGKIFISKSMVYQLDIMMNRTITAHKRNHKLFLKP